MPDSNATTNQPDGADKEAIVPQDHIVATHHTVTIDGQAMAYTATAGTMVLKEEAEKKGENEGESEGQKPRASVFFVAYARDDVEDKSSRPITFSFNGGPGSSSVWLHLGLLGPRRVLLDDEGMPLPPPYRLVENEASLLDASDLVFIDPVSTGYSRPVPGEKAKDFHAFNKDIESVGDFIRLYLSRYGRWTSPKFLAGESYGTTRAAGLSGYLQERHGMYLNGLMLISSVLDFQTILFEPANDLAHLLYLPAFAASAWYHGRLSPELQQRSLRQVLAEVEQFAVNDYALALLRGDALPAEERVAIARQLAGYTGLSQDYVERTDLRVKIMRYVKELLRDRRRTVGRLDSRYTGIDRDAAGEHFEHDPSSSATMGPYTATFNDYVRGELQFESDLPYEILAPIYKTWRYDDQENKYVNVAETLRKAMSVNPQLQVFVASGYYDLATPYFATRYTFDHLGLDPDLRDNIRMGYY
ncbi:MAG: S10 family peptidase, partial [Anaerolineae bacterium]